MARKAQATPASRVPPAAGGRFQAALNARREHYNQRFRMSRALRPGLDADAFGRSLRRWAAPLVEALADGSADTIEAHSEALFEIALALLQAGHAAGEDAHRNGLDRLWQLLSEHSAAIAADPIAITARLCNAWLFLAGQPGVRRDEWLEGVALLLDRTAADHPLDALLGAVQVLAWRCGVATLRASALSRAATLPATLLATALGLARPIDGPMDALLGRLREDPWTGPELPSTPPRLHEVGRIGGLRGLGGAFVEVPEVILLEGRIALQDRSGPLRFLYADRFGAQLSADASGPPTLAASPIALQCDGQRLSHPASASSIVLPGTVAHWTCDGHTAAVVLQRSYMVRLYAVCSLPEAST
jgi:hypothetical protein